MMVCAEAVRSPPVRFEVAMPTVLSLSREGFAQNSLHDLRATGVAALV